MLDKWAFGMSKIDPNDSSKPGSLKANGAESSEEGRRALSEEMNQTSERISQLQFDMNGQPQEQQQQRSTAGPSLLSQQAPDHPAFSTSPKEDLSPEKFPISNDGPSLSTVAITPDAPLMDGTERITVKIADLGNGTDFHLHI